MKLHAWDTKVDDTPIRAFTRDRARKSLKQAVTVLPEDITILPKEWNYAGVISTTGIDSDYIRELHQIIRNKGFAIVELPKLKENFFVFDISFDVVDVRVYSDDKELSEFKKARQRMELGVQGHNFLGGEEKYIGEVEIPSKAAAKQMGIDDFDFLQSNGFWVSVVRISPREEALRRYLERELPKSVEKKVKSMGMKLVELRVHKVTFKPSGDRKSNSLIEKESKVIQLDNNTLNKEIDKSELKALKDIDELTELDRLIRYWKNRPWIARLLILIFAIGGFAALLKAITEITKFFS